jgi:hypothetical protein
MQIIWPSNVSDSLSIPRLILTGHRISELDVNRKDRRPRFMQRSTTTILQCRIINVIQCLKHMERTATSYPEVLGSLIPFHQGPLNLTRKCNSYRFRVPDGPSEARNSRSYVIDHKCLQYCLYIQIHCIAHFKKTILQLENKTPK